MDRLRFRRRFRLLLAVGGILVALAYMGILTNRARLTWANYRAEADFEDGRAEAEAMFARDVGQLAEQAGRQGRNAEAEHWVKIEASSRRRESLHRGKSRELLSQWW